MTVQHNFDLTDYNTFHIPAYAERWAAFSDAEELDSFVENEQNAPLILGGGSNVLFTGNVPGLVLHNQVRGMAVISETDEHVHLRAGAGEVWHQLVMYVVGKGWGGLENLSLIPGNVGASPMQNIGAYGVEIKDVFLELEAFHLRERYLRTFSAAECRFGYRDSIFKNELKGQFAILSVSFQLTRHPRFNISYGTIEKQLSDMQIQQLSVKAVSDAVIAIRSSKLPDPRVLGNAGSFFKNPMIDPDQFHALQKEYAGIPSFKFGEHVKVPAAWLIEQCGFKGYRSGPVGCYEKQPLVLVNYGGASGKQVYDFSEEIIHTVANRFGIILQREVNVI